MLEAEHIRVERQDAGLYIHLNRPEKKNALSLAMYERMTALLGEAESDAAIRVVVLQGVSGCFTSGNDLADFAQLVSRPEQLDSPQNPILAFMNALARCSKPIVALVDGVAVGIGTTLLLHCDLVYCSAQASFSLPFVNLGLCPEYASSLLIPRLAGHVKAAEWLMLGETISAEEAGRFGLVNAVVNDLDTYSQQKIQRLVRQAPEAVRVCKRLLKAETKVLVEQSMTTEIEDFKKALAGPEFAEAVAAFFEKREANYSEANYS
ncbi:Enoyl-CoA hydratase/carnithine racemase [Alteromonadaceae bacterium Bs31]|nr:Enoyl-CoA hydratase/carnithine racemase [Alteromonadaceae bacterium Bs31]